MIPTPPIEARNREEARRQVEGGGLDGAAEAAELGADVVGLASGGAFDLAAQAAGSAMDLAAAALGATAEVAKASLDAVGGLLSGLDGL